METLEQRILREFDEQLPDICNRQDEVKEFILKALAQQREEIRKEIEGKKHTASPFTTENRTLNEVLNLPSLTTKP